jgi:outer membrane immunogenic protein
MRREIGKVLFVTALTVPLVGISVVANAAELPVPAPIVAAPPPPPPYNWTGFYLGANLGAGWKNGNLTDSVFGVNWSANKNATFVGGGQVGFNYQFNRVVVGIEADFDWFANDNNSATVTAFGTAVRDSNNDRWLTTLTGRLGFAWDRVLFYGKGGGAWISSNNFSVTNVATGSSVSIVNNNTIMGWTAGAGIEWAFANNWTARVEYDYVGLQDNSFTVPVTFPVVGGDVFTTHNRNIQMVTVGINYLFSWGPYDYTRTLRY